MTVFLIVNGAFVAIFIALAITQPPWWGWVLFIGLWIAADYYIAKDVHLAWWHWALLVAGLTAVDMGVLYGTGQL